LSSNLAKNAKNIRERGLPFTLADEFDWTTAAPRPQDAMTKPDPEMIDKENPEWTDAMFAKARPASEVFPDLAAHSEKRKRGQRGPQKKPRKVLIALRLERSTVEAYKAGGRGYQTRMAAVLKKHAKINS